MSGEEEASTLRTMLKENQGLLQKLRDECEELREQNDAFARINRELADAIRVEKEANAALMRQLQEVQGAR